MSDRLLLAHAAADLYEAELRDRFPSLDFRICRSADELVLMLDRYRPTIVYSCVTHAFPRHLHRPIIDCESVRWLHVGGSGFEHFRGFDGDRLIVTNGAGVLAPCLADTVIGAIIALNNGLLHFHKNQQSRRYAPKTHPALAGQRLLIVGPGAIGREVAKRAQAFGIHCTAVTRKPRELVPFDEVVDLRELDAALAQADIVSLHLPLSDATRGMFDRQKFACLKHGSIFVNAARGAVVDEAAMVDVFRSGHIQGAYLDVFATEPLPEMSPLWAFEDVLITPHCSDQVDDWQERHARFFFENLWLFLSGRELRNRVDP